MKNHQMLRVSEPSAGAAGERLSIRKSSTSVATPAREKISTFTVDPVKWVRHLGNEVILMDTVDKNHDNMMDIWCISDGYILKHPDTTIKINKSKSNPKRSRSIAMAIPLSCCQGFHTKWPMIQEGLVELHQENQGVFQTQIGVIHRIGQKEWKILKEEGLLQMPIQKEDLIQGILIWCDETVPFFSHVQPCSATVPASVALSIRKAIPIFLNWSQLICLHCSFVSRLRAACRKARNKIWRK